MKQENLEAKLIANARAIITHEVALPLGCIRMSKILSWLGNEHKQRYCVFSDFLTATRGLPLASERLHWSREALIEKDRQLAVIIERFREPILAACFDIIETVHERECT